MSGWAYPRIALPLGAGELAAVLWRLLTGPRADPSGAVGRFEATFAGHYRRRGAVAFCKARMAFYHVLRALDLPAGAEVVMSPLHVADYVNIIRLAGFKPVLVDLQPDGFCLDLDDLRRKTGPATGAILVTHLSGYAHDMDAIAALAAEKGAVLLEDCSQAFSASFGGRPLGSFGCAAIYSLSLLKSICTLTGGVVVSDDDRLLERLRAVQRELAPPLRGPLIAEAVKNLVIKLALLRPLFSLVVLPLLRLTATRGDRLSQFQKANKTVDLRERLPPQFLTAFSWQQALLGLGQWRSFAARESARIAAAQALYAAIPDSEEIRCPSLTPGGGNTWWLFPLLVRQPARVKAELARRGVDSAQMLLSCIPDEPAFADLGLDRCPNAKRLHERTLFVPMYHGLAPEDIRRIGEAVAACSGQSGRDASR